MKKYILVFLVLAMVTGGYAQQSSKRKKLNGVEKVSSQQKPSPENRINRKPDQRIAPKTQFAIEMSQEKGINSTWDVQFQTDVEIGSGIATNGSSFFVSQWNNDTIYVYNTNGVLIGKNKIAVTGIRDMTYDGTFFYGSNTGNKIYKLNFSNFTVIDSIVCPAYINVRHISYDNNNNAFWVGDWDTDIYLVNHSGQVINTISANNHELNGMYGSAYDNTTPGGPYLWVFDQGGNGCDIIMLKISTGKATGIFHDCYDDVAEDLFEATAGGMFIQPNLFPGTVTLGGILQRQRIFGYNLATLVATNDVGVEGVISPIMHSGCNLSNNETISIRLRNYGLNTTSYFTAHMLLNGTPYTVNVTNPIPSFGTLDITFPGTFNFSQPNIYKMKFYTSYGYDNNPANDTGYYNIIIGNGLITVNVLTDDYPKETYWEVHNNFSYDVYGSSWGIMPNFLHSTDVCVDTNLCYGFTIYDFYGDGIFSPGYYEVLFKNQSVAYNENFTTLFEEIPYIGHCDYADIGIVGILNPVSSCDLSTDELVTIVVKNFGTQTVSNAQVAYSVNGTTYTEPLPFSLDSQEEISYTFVNTSDLSNIGMFEINAYTVLNNDMNPFNDTLRLLVESYIPAHIPYYIDFDNQAVNAQLLVEDENHDYFTWGLYNYGGISNSHCAIYSFNPNEPAKDWLYTKCLTLYSGQTYYLNFYVKAQSVSYPEKMKVHICEAPYSMAALTTPIVDLSAITDTVFTLTSVPFNVNDLGTGSYYLGFNVYSGLNGWNLYLDNISITNTAAIEETSKQTTTVSLYPNPAGSSITVSILNDELFGNESHVCVYSLQGQLLLKQTSSQKTINIDVAELGSGMYLMKIENDNGIWVKKFLKN